MLAGSALFVLVGLLPRSAEFAIHEALHFRGVRDLVGRKRRVGRAETVDVVVDTQQRDVRLDLGALEILLVD